MRFCQVQNGQDALCFQAIFFLPSLIQSALAMQTCTAKSRWLNILHHNHLVITREPHRESALAEFYLGNTVQLLVAMSQTRWIG